MDGYTIFKWLHVVSSTVLFGTGLGTAFHMWITHRRGAATEIALAARNTVLADWLFTLPSGIVQPVTGFALVSWAGWDPLSPWLVVTYGLYGVALASWAPVVVIQIAIARVAVAAVDRGHALPARYHRLMRAWFWLGWPAFISLLVIFWLMVTKPELW